MSNYTHQTAPTQFVEAAGIRFAYRRFGAKRASALIGPFCPIRDARFKRTSTSPSTRIPGTIR
jgi:hypothetical protein